MVYIDSYLEAVERALEGLHPPLSIRAISAHVRSHSRLRIQELSNRAIVSFGFNSELSVERDVSDPIARICRRQAISGTKWPFLQSRRHVLWDAVACEAVHYSRDLRGLESPVE